MDTADDLTIFENLVEKGVLEQTSLHQSFDGLMSCCQFSFHHKTEIRYTSTNAGKAGITPWENMNLHLSLVSLNRPQMSLKG